MTRDEVLALKSGRELDALVAEKVMGFKCEIDKGRQVVRWSAMGAYGEWHTPPMTWKKWNYKVPPYSTGIAAAFEILDMFKVYEIYKYLEGVKVVVLRTGQRGVAKADSVPEAICKAALLAVMGE